MSVDYCNTALLAALLATATIVEAQTPPAPIPPSSPFKQADITHESSKPFVALSEEGGPAKLRYTIPEPTSYPGRYFIALEDVAKTAFKSNAYQELEEREVYCRQGEPKDIVKKLKPGGLFQPFGLLTKLNTTPSNVPTPSASSVPYGIRLISRMSLFGTLSVQLVPCGPTPPPSVAKLMIVESYRLTSFAGDYGAGKTIKTFTLFPGEKTAVRVKTYQRQSETRKQASSILDSFTQDSADEFEQAISTEHTDKEAHAESQEYKADVHAEQGWGGGKASVNASASISMNASREEFSKNVHNAVNKHANRASSKRDITVTNSTDTTEESGEETETQRVVENINVSRTLNLVFRQMNQQFISVLHLVDIRIGYYRRTFSGTTAATVYKEVPLPEAGVLLSNVLSAPAEIQRVQEAISRHVSALRSLDGKEVPDFVSKLESNQGWQISRKYKSPFLDPITNKSIPEPVPGLVVSGSTNVLRTDGVIIEAVLGQGNALDGYSKGLQDESVRQRQFQNEKESLRLKIIKDNDGDRAKLFEALFREPVGAGKTPN